MNTLKRAYFAAVLHSVFTRLVEWIESIWWEIKSFGHEGHESIAESCELIEIFRDSGFESCYLAIIRPLQFKIIGYCPEHISHDQ